MVMNFNCDSSGFCMEHAKLLSECAKIAYRPELDAVKALKGLGFECCEVIEQNDVSCILAAACDFVVVAFRGTDPSRIKNILTDMDVLQDDDVLGKVHAGFFNGLKQVEKDLFKALYGYFSQGKKLWITGHSLGGALAALFAGHIAWQGYEVCGVYTYGQPRVGSKGFKNYYESLLEGRHFRFVNSNDVVTRLPLRRFKKLVYKHVGKMVYIKSNENIVFSPPFWLVLADRIKGRIKGALSGCFRVGMADHGVDNYCRAIGKIE